MNSMPAWPTGSRRSWNPSGRAKSSSGGWRRARRSFNASKPNWRSRWPNADRSSRSCANSSRRTKRQRERLEGQLRETGIELARLKVELESRVTKHGSTESELSEQLAAAKAAAKKAEAARNEEAERGRQIDAELRRLKQASVESNAKLVETEQVAARSRQRGEEFERRLAESAV